MTDGSEGKRFSQVYLRHADLLPDSVRMRNRIALLIANLGDERYTLGKLVEREQGILLGECSYVYHWPPILKRLELRDVLDMITTVHMGLNSVQRGQHFIKACRRIFSEEQVSYRIDDCGGVHLAVDQQFENSRASTITLLGAPRYRGVLSLFEDAFAMLDRQPPDGKAALRASFFATESLFRLMFPTAHQLSGGEVQKHLEPLVNKLYADQKPAVNLAQKLVASFRDWIDGAHFYRHEPGNEEPAQPPLELAIYMLNESAGHIRWLAKLDDLKKC